MWALAQKITSTEDLLSLALTGLNADEDNVNRNLRDNRDSIVVATYNVLRVWRDSQPDRVVAYTKLCDALRTVNKGAFIRIALK